MEVQHNAYAAEETTVHSLSLSEDATRRLQDVRSRVAGALRSNETNFEHAMNDIRQTISNEAHRAGEAMDHAGDNVKRAFSPTSHSQSSPKLQPQPQPQPQQPQQQQSRQQQRTAAGEEDEEWMSDAEGDGSSGSTEEEAGPSSEVGRQKSRSPKIKAPKLAVLRPGRRRMSIRRGMLGARIAHPLHPREHKEHEAGEGHGGAGEGEGLRHRPGGVLLPPGMSRESSGSEQERGRRLRPVDSRASSVRLMHHRVDSLRSIDTRREASPARSVRWADEDGNNNSNSGSGRRSGGLGSPGILSPVTPTGSLPGSNVPSDDEGDGGEGHTPTHTVRFDMPGPTARDRR